MLKKYSMWVDTASGNIKLIVEASNGEDAKSKFKMMVETDTFNLVHGNVYDMKYHTLQEVSNNE